MLIEDLISAQHQHSLINVYQSQSDVFYTGYVEHLGNDGTVFRTYNDNGINDGLVYIAMPNITKVEFYSKDLMTMAVKIKVSRLNALLEYVPQKPYPLQGKDQLAKQILGRAFVGQEMVMLRIQGRSHYLEGLVLKVGDNRFRFLKIDKYHFAHQEQFIFAFRDVQIVEFQGKELSLLSAARKMLLGPSTVPLVQNMPALVVASLHQAQKDQRLVAVKAYQDKTDFYVGWVIAMNNEAVVLKVVDMCGQFGGYVWMRLASIRMVTILSDYVNLVDRMVELNKNMQNYVQPVLNADRAFDPTNNLPAVILSQLEHAKHFVRIRTMDQSQSTVGSIVKVSEQACLFRPLHPKQDPQANASTTEQEIMFSNLQQIAFDYLDTFMQRKLQDLKKWEA